jgi:hypothetical protein
MWLRDRSLPRGVTFVALARPLSLMAGATPQPGSHFSRDAYMSGDPVVTRTPHGLLFGPSASGKHYISLNYHRRLNAASHEPSARSRSKSQWRPTISRTQEYRLFCLADASSWRDETGRHWALLNTAKTVLGMAGERLSTFPFPSNQDGPWHGYPISTRAGVRSHVPTDGLISLWERTGIITRVVATRLRRRKI